MTRSRSLRAGAALVAALFAVTLIGACSSSDNEKADVAKDDRAVVQHNQAEAEYRAKIKAALRVKWQAQAKVRRAQARARARARAAARNQQVLVRTPRGNVVRSAGAGDLCAPIRSRASGKAGRAERRARREQRRQALDYLNLRCPARGAPGI